MRGKIATPHNTISDTSEGCHFVDCVILTSSDGTLCYIFRHSGGSYCVSHDDFKVQLDFYEIRNQVIFVILKNLCRYFFVII